MRESAESSRDRHVVVKRRFRASREFLFRAWTDPERLACWFGPKGWAVDRCEVDARPGGCWRAWFRRSSGGNVYVGGVYSEVERNRRIVFTWDTSPEGGEPEALSVVSVEFRDESDGVEICITHRKLGTEQAVDMEVGWNNTFDSLEAYVAAQAGD